MHIFYLLVLAVMVSFNNTANAEDIECANAVTQSDMTVCAAQSLKKAETDLNAVYQKAWDHFSEKDKADDFEKSHDAWIAYRDAHCAFDADQYRGGSIRPLVAASCMETLAKERTWHIVNLFPEWD